MKVFAITYNYTKNSGELSSSGLSIEVCDGLEDLIALTKKKLEENDEYDRGSFFLNQQVFLTMPKLLERVRMLSEKEEIEAKSVEEIKKLPTFEALIKEL